MNRSRWGTLGVLLAVFLFAPPALLPSAARKVAHPDDDDDDAHAVFRVIKTGELVGLGARRPTPAEWAWGEQHMLKTRSVRLNRLGVERVNRALKAKGRRMLRDAAAVPVGAEPSGDDGSLPPALPAGVDNSQLKFFPPIRSQGSLGSCAQFSAVYYTLTHMTAMARDWDAKAGGDTYRFSPKWTYNVLNGGQNVGTWHYDAYAIAIKHGLATWAEFPYDSNYRAWCLNPAVWRNALRVRAEQTGKVRDVDTGTGLDQVKQLLVNGYVLNFATYISSWQWKALGNDSSTPDDDALAGKNCVLAVSGTSGGHAMTIVGYNDAAWVDVDSDGVVDADEKGAFRIANSWGTGWGEAGYCWLSYNAVRARNPSRTSEGAFWYDEACWVTARAAYEPQLIGEFTLNHLKRNQLVVTLGRSDTGVNTPTTLWSPNKILTWAGGAYAFDGTTVATDATFCLDFTDILPAEAGPQRYYVGVQDTTLGDPALLKSFKLIDPGLDVEIAGSGTPQYADGVRVYAAADYDFYDSGSNIAPLAVAGADPISGSVPLVVTFDGSASCDPDGSIVSWSWSFGDGATASGAVVQHTYTQAGTFDAVLTVTDDAAEAGTAHVFVTAEEPPAAVVAPSSLSAKAANQAVTLTWTDNSDNETGFVVERATKLKRGYSEYEAAGTPGANATSFTETVAAGTYSYRVKAVNANAGIESPYSNVASVKVR